MARIIGYARVSTAEQATNSHALEQQEERLRQAGAIEVWTDVQTGSSNKRPNYRRLLSEIGRGDIGEIIVTRIDRLARSLPDLRVFADACVARGVNLRILDQQIDLSTPHGKLMLNMLGSVAEWERDLLISRVNNGLKHQRQQLRAPGIVPFGYIRKDDRYVPNTEEYRDTGKTHWQIAREVIEAFLEVQTIRGTARIMGDRYPARGNSKGGGEFADFPRENGLKYWLKSPVLRGHMAYYYRTRNKEPEIIPNQHERLVSEAEAAEIDRALLVVTREKPFADRLPLTGLMYCGLCGAKARAFKYTRNGRLIVRWYCSGKYSAPPTCTDNPGIRNEKAIAAVIDALVQRAEAIANLVESIDGEVPDSDEILRLRESLESLERIPDNEAIREAKLKIRNQIAAKRSELRERKNTDELLREELVESCADQEFWNSEDLTDDIKRRLFRRFVERVVVQSGVVQVQMRV